MGNPVGVRREKRTTSPLVSEFAAFGEGVSGRMYNLALPVSAEINFYVVR